MESAPVHLKLRTYVFTVRLGCLKTFTRMVPGVVSGSRILCDFFFFFLLFSWFASVTDFYNHEHTSYFIRHNLNMLFKNSLCHLVSFMMETGNERGSTFLLPVSSPAFSLSALFVSPPNSRAGPSVGLWSEVTGVGMPALTPCIKQAREFPPNKAI